MNQPKASDAFDLTNMTRTANTTTIIDMEAKGGEIAIKGFKFQLHSCLVRVPMWLKDPCFESIMYEGMDDYEVKFFDQYKDNVKTIHVFQVKSGEIDAADIKGIVERFYSQSDKKTPSVYHVLYKSIKHSLEWLSGDSRRIEKRSDFDKTDSAETDVARNKYIDRVKKVIGLVEYSHAEFLACNIRFTKETIDGEKHARYQFEEQCVEHDLTPPDSHKEAFSRLESLFDSRIGDVISAEEIVGTIKNNKIICSKIIKVHFKSSNSRNDVSDAINMNTEMFSGDNDTYPEEHLWHSDLVLPLQRIAQRHQSHQGRSIIISGRMRLSTSFVVGNCFREVHGFSVSIDNKWTKENDANSHSTGRFTHASQLHNDNLIVAVGVIRQPLGTLTDQGIPTTSIASYYQEFNVSSEDEASSISKSIKKNVSELVDALNPRSIYMYLACPFPVAVFLGQLWNAMPPTHLYEFNANERTYKHVFTCLDEYR